MRSTVMCGLSRIGALALVGIILCSQLEVRFEALAEQVQQHRTRGGGQNITVLSTFSTLGHNEGRRTAGCQDETDPFEYTTKKGTKRTKCKRVAKTLRRGYDKLKRKCDRFLADDSGDRVEDMCRMTCKKCKSQHLGYGPEVARRIDSAASCPEPQGHDEDASVLLAVTTREIYVGCHSFREYLSPKFRTIFILNEDAALEWGIDDMVRNAPCGVSLGATIFMLRTFGGEIYGRKLAMDFIDNEHPRTNFLMQMNCDVHPLPKSHNWYKTVEDSVLKSAKDFHMARAQRNPKKFDVEVPNFPLVDNLKSSNKMLKLSILSMSFILLESVADDYDLLTDFHGVDGCKWKVTGGRESRPKEFGGKYEDKYPWLCTGSKMENHALMFDVGNLRIVRGDYFDSANRKGARSFASDTRFSPDVAAKHGMTVVTHRDVYFHQDFAHDEETLAKYDRGVDKNWIRALSWGSLGWARGPEMVYRVFDAYSNIGMDETPRFGGTGISFAIRHVKSSDSPWNPERIQGTPLTDKVGRQLLSGLMSLFGYEVYDESGGTLSYRLQGLYPANNHVVMTSKKDSCSDCWRFMHIKYNGQSLYLTALGRVQWGEIKRMSPTERIIKVPAKASIEGFYGPSDAEDVEYLSAKGRHRPGSSNMCDVPELEDLKACGYEEPTKFDQGYTSVG